MNIDEAWYSQEGGPDIGLCSLQPIERNGQRLSFVPLKLDLNVPMPGQIIGGYGYRLMDGTIDHESDKALEIAFKQRATLTSGRIIQVQEERRDRAMLSWPCFETNARFDPGMSGGPVFNEQGCVCGVICSSLAAPPDSSQSHYSHASLIWPSLACHMEVSTAPGVQPSNFSLYDLVRANFIVINGDITRFFVEQINPTERRVYRQH